MESRAKIQPYGFGPLQEGVGNMYRILPVGEDQTLFEMDVFGLIIPYREAVFESKLGEIVRLLALFEGEGLHIGELKKSAFRERQVFREMVEHDDPAERAGQGGDK
jgi:hypothetical protein